MSLLPCFASADVPQRGGKLIVGVKGGSASDTLDPVLMTAEVSTYMSYQYGNMLFERTPGGEVKGDLVESWEPLEGGKRWDIKLRQGVKFHNGKELTSADVIYSLNRHRGPDTKSGAAALMKSIGDIKAEGPYQLTISLKEPDVGPPYLLAYGLLVIQPKDESPDRGIGTGPYVVDIAEPGKRYILHRNSDYFKPNSAWFDQLEVLVINDDVARISALLSGSVHLITELPPNLVNRLKNTPSLNIVDSPATRFFYFVMQVDQPPFDNPDLRLALKYAVDRETILKDIAAGYGDVGNDQPINSVYPLFSDDIPKRTYDLEKAKFHYKKSGHTGPIVLHTAEVFPGAVNMSTIFQQSAAKAGIVIEVKREPVDGYWENVWLKVPFCVSYWGHHTTEDQALSLPYASDSPGNDAHWHRPEFDKLLAKARGELDPQLRKSLYREAAMMVHDDGGYIVVMFSHNIGGIASTVKGYVSDPFAGLQRATQRCWFEN